MVIPIGVSVKICRAMAAKLDDNRQKLKTSQNGEPPKDHSNKVWLNWLSASGIDENESAKWLNFKLGLAMGAFKITLS